ncbi:camphor resistance protein CrcB [Erythrobacter sp. NAP1]|uniref:fluoride efflux transporter CrcB n=1 Tax=Erythrobacter sp. NAP1 TaxID=237727 RepID=UPI0000686AA8|nr:fluoride efflux transporter CrcB [Erythrobacter sp. NAP1]EAQ29206.1 camphor resistance protein CrcB [Erythrobacter sp. NAP1]
MSTASLSPALASLYVALGGGIGAVGRYQAGRLVTHMAPSGATFPWPTLAVNVVGSLAMGLLFGWLARASVAAQTGETLRLLVGVGLLGGFTTFSAFSAEMVTMMHRAAYLPALAYVGVSVIAGMAAFIIGLVMGQSSS